MARATTARRTRGTRPDGAAPPRRKDPPGGGRRLPRAGILGAALAVLVALAAGYFLLSPRGGAGALSVLRTGDFHALAISPTDPNVVYFGHHNGLMRSDDGGRTWRPVVDRRNFDAMGLAVARTDGRRVYLAGHDVFQVSADGGATWQPVASNLPGTDIHGFASSPDDPDRLYAFVVGQGALQSGDGGRSWQKLPGQLPPDVMGLAAAGPTTLYAASMRGGLLRSADGGATWAPTKLPDGAGMPMALAIDPAARQTVYAGAETGLYRSTDGGANWGKLPFPSGNVTALAVSPAQPNVLLAISVEGRDGLVYRSQDGGQSWGAGA